MTTPIPTSAGFAAHFALDLPADVTAWLDEKMWRRTAATFYNQPEHPDQLLNPASFAIWGGQMLPDTFPWLGDGCGNVFALRFDAQGRVREVIVWDHEGGSWRPYGRTLTEALLLDAARSARTAEPDDAWLRTRFAAWALRRPENAELASQLRTAARTLPPREALLSMDCATEAILQSRCEERLSSPLRQHPNTGKVTRTLGLNQQTLTDCFADTALIPQESVDILARELGMPAEELLQQDWPGAEADAMEVIARRNDQCWAFTVAGRAAERRGGTAAAIALYERSLFAPKTTSSFTTYWRTALPRPWPLSYAMGRLDTLAPDRKDVPDEIGRYLSAALRERDMRAYWLEQAERTQERAYDCVWNAGWDDFYSNDMPALLERLARAAAAIGSEPLRRLAERHRASCR